MAKQEYIFTKEDNNIISLLPDGQDQKYIEALEAGNQRQIEFYRSHVKQKLERNSYFEIQAESGMKLMSSITVRPDGGIQFIDGTTDQPYRINNSHEAETLLAESAPEYLRVRAAFSKHVQEQQEKTDKANLTAIEKDLILPLMKKYNQQFREAREIVDAIPKEKIMSQIFNLSLLEPQNLTNLIKQGSSEVHLRLRKYAHTAVNLAAILELSGNQESATKVQETLVTLLNLCLAADGNDIPSLAALQLIHQESTESHKMLATCMIETAKAAISKSCLEAVQEEKKEEEVTATDAVPASPSTTSFVARVGTPRGTPAALPQVDTSDQPDSATTSSADSFVARVGTTRSATATHVAALQQDPAKKGFSCSII